jgi:hypothetical protein
MEDDMRETAQPTKLTKGQKPALKAIAGGSDTFQLISERLEALCLAHLRYRQGLQLQMGWSFAQRLRAAWAAAHHRQRAVRITLLIAAERTHATSFSSHPRLSPPDPTPPAQGHA